MDRQAGPFAEVPAANGSRTPAPLGGIYRSSLDWLPAYVRESYRLSACNRSPRVAEIAAHRGLLMCGTLQIANFSVLAAYMEEGAAFRTTDRLDAGGSRTKSLEAAFEQLLHLANQKQASADELAALFRLLSPFTQANGRCSRALWMWRMARGSDTERARLNSATAAEQWASKKEWVLHA